MENILLRSIKKIKIFAISDLHMSTANPKPMDVFGRSWENYLEKIFADWKKKVTDEDLVLICGDISWAMKLEEAVTDINLLSPLKGKKIFIKGNHDYWWSAISRIREKLPTNFFCVQNDAVKFENFVIFGSRGWLTEGAPDFSTEDKKIYLREAERLKLAYNAAKKLMNDGDNLICMMHYPPFNVRREDSLFTQFFEQNEIKTVVYGHLHGKDSRCDLILNKGGVKYYLTSCDRVNNQLVEIF